MPLGFAEFSLVGNVVQRIIHQLEGDADLHAECGQGLFLFRRTVAEDGTDPARGGYQDSCLIPDNTQVTLFVHVEVTGIDKLLHLALGHLGGRVRQGPQDIEIPFANHNRKRFGEEEITDQDRRFVAPDRVGRLLAPAQNGTIDNIVMQQGRGMDKLDHAGQPDVLSPAITSQARRKQQQHRPHPLAAAAENIFADLANQGNIRSQVFFELLLDPGKIIIDKIQNFIHGLQLDSIKTGKNSTCLS